MKQFTNKIAFKLNRIRKKNWSAPSIMACFITICMIIIFSFEALGLAKREKNLEYRSKVPEKMIEVKSQDLLHDMKDMSYLNNNDKSVNESIRLYTEKEREKDKEQQIENMKRILAKGVEEQLIYEGRIKRLIDRIDRMNNKNKDEFEENIIEYDEEMDFFDM